MSISYIIIILQSQATPMLTVAKRIMILPFIA